ncbi:hypothetical protein ACH5RR_004260 [Cinchona calisaya]|uniref:RING-type E3 ubiquitin transferase n=1 Tax=Cinchona calisaya TaxID=153742 RepID=A0ABD3AX43_9GENT
MSFDFDMPTYFDDPPVVYRYSRLPEIERQCSPFLSSASELKLDDSRGSKIKKELSFFNGDWIQELDGSPLVPFDDSDIPRDGLSVSSPLKLVGFEIKDVNPVHQLRNAVSLCGTMCIGMARNSTLLYNSRSIFYMAPGMSVLKISFEGVYIETERNGGERLLCMLGSTSLPVWNSASDKSRTMSSSSNHKPGLLQDGRMLLVLRYHQIFSLTKRAILGELKSLNEPGKPRYFDVVHISSQLSRFSKYEFSYEELKSETRDLSLYRKEVEEDGANRFNNTEFCKVMRLFSGHIFKIIPNWRFMSTSGLGPFLLGQENKANDSSYKNVWLIMQNLICEQEIKATQIRSNSARVAAVFRVFPAEKQRERMKETAAMRTGLSGMTLSVEGTWDALEGHLCLVGCPGITSSGLQGCDSQISLYFPHSFSIKLRSIIFGSITSKSYSYDPVLFELEIRPQDLKFDYVWYSRSYLTYKYSKIELAEAFRKRSQLSGLFNLIKPLFLSYPGKRSQLSRLATEVKRLFLGNSASRQAKDDVFTYYEMYSLSNDLDISCYGTPVPSYNSYKPEIFIHLEVLALGPLVSGRAPWLDEDSPPLENEVKMSKSEVLNVSLSLVFTGERLEFTDHKDYKNISKLFLEGLYDPLAGEMHLIGCRRITVDARNLNLERGFDCLIEVKIEYPDETSRWLINPKAEITITSQRNEDDALYFHPIKLQTSMLSYNQYEQDAVFRKVFEEILRNLMMIVSIALISSQLLYMKENVDGIPYVSRIMLSFQFLGYVYPLLCNTKILLQEKEYRGPNNSYGYEQILTILDYTGKLFVLAALVMTVTLTRKVAEYRKNPHPGSPSKSITVHQDKKARQIIAVILVLGLLSYYLLYSSIFQNENINALGEDQFKKLWSYKPQEFIGIIQDLFLLPQVTESMITKTPFRPLRKLYYIGFTLMRIGLHLYDLVRDPVINPYYDEPAFLNLDLFFTSTASNLALIVIMTVLAMVLYMQQEGSHQKFIQQQEIASAKSL